MEEKFSIIQVLAGHNANGPVHEELPARRLDDGAYRLLASPGLALGLAKNDLISLNREGEARLLTHGGNFCIHIYLENPGIWKTRAQRKFPGLQKSSIGNFLGQ
ncbi:DUF4265 domain-containing protein (plasmid) [Agrobacterium sp. rho-13.3]|uniref:DUF4265 domain-containing protein n=1 Tax=Agrobacterium sp. rho-13.3 TaxID=3072980 RepID=UPI002A0B06C5|nr:DUF4265 domain-containing protein [Agrobacterium sp. rho-13.3]MDX8310149.1 DUF4265 domain-containing protein [Agrobacterium sp. rho-13.3]